MSEGGRVVSDERSELERALADAPDDAGLLLRLGRAELDAGRLIEAEDCFRRALDKAATAEAFEGLGVALNRLGRFRESLPFLRQAVSLRPDSAQAWNSAGEALGNLGQVPEAAEAFARAVAANGDFAPAHYNLGLTRRGVATRIPGSIACARDAAARVRQVPGGHRLLPKTDGPAPTGPRDPYQPGGRMPDARGPRDRPRLLRDGG
jgi:tetratricopeptide (TPR) repeat protein